MRLWQTKRGQRPMPSRADFDPNEFKRLLPNIFLVDVLPPPQGYRMRLMGDELVTFHGQQLSGKTLDESFDPPVAALLNQLLDAVVRLRAPIFRAGKAYWVREKAYRDYESCYFPLSADGTNVNMILGAMKFPQQTPE